MNARAIRVLLVGPIPPPWAGVEVVSSLLLSSGHEYRVEYVHADTSNVSNSAKGSWTALNIVRALFQFARFFIRAVACRLQGIRIVHIPLAQNTSGVLRDCLYMWSAQRLGYKVVVHFHGGSFCDFYERTRFREPVRRVLGSVDCLIVLGEQLKKQFSFVPPNRIVVVPNPVSDQWFHAFPDHKPPSLLRPLRVLFVGHLSVAKGLVDLVEATAVVSRSRAVELHCLGEVLNRERNVKRNGMLMNDGMATVKHLVRKLKLGDSVFFHGVLTGDAKIKAFLDADVLCLPSYSEGMPLVVEEAMAAGLVVIGTNVGAVGEILEAEWLVGPGQPESIAEKLLTIDAGVVYSVGERNRRKACELFRVSRIMAMLVAVYVELLR